MLTHLLERCFIDMLRPDGHALDARLAQRLTFLHGHSVRRLTSAAAVTANIA
jgi:hypothetical protein